MKKEKPSTKICKHCKTEIPYDAKICPQCRKKQGMPIWLIAIIVIVVIGVIGAIGSGKKDGKTTSASSPVTSTTQNKEITTAAETAATETTIAETVPPVKASYGIGEAADINGIQVAMTSVTNSNGSDFLKPDEGNVFVLCEFNISNGSKKDINVSSILSFEAYCDDYSVSQDILGLQAPEAKGKNQLDGSIAAGKKMNGIIAYQVPKDWKTLEIKFTPSFWSNKSATFIATE